MTADLAGNLSGGVKGAFGAVGGLFTGKQAKAGKEDKEAELETLRNVKVFLTAKLKQNEEVTSTLQKDIGILKEILRIEKSITQKTKAQLDQKIAELKDTRATQIESEAKLKEQISQLSLRETEHITKIERLNDEKKKLKNHKALLKEEVLRQRAEINTLERVTSQKT